MNQAARAILKQTPVMPVISINDIETAVPLAKALLAGGIPVLEITLRTSLGLEAISRIKQQVEGVIVGAGTIVNKQNLSDAIAAGSEFIITPGLTNDLLNAGIDCGVPFMPGVATVSELMRCVEKGLNTVKFFPAEAAGGAKVLKAFAGPFPDVAFCPTGGIGLHNIAQYLAVPSVLSVGGSWIVPESLIAEGNWAAITQLAQEASQLVAATRKSA